MVNEMRVEANDKLIVGLVPQRRHTWNLRGWFRSLSLKFQSKIIMDAPEDLRSPLDEYAGRDKAAMGTEMPKSDGTDTYRKAS